MIMNIKTLHVAADPGCLKRRMNVIWRQVPRARGHKLLRHHGAVPLIRIFSIKKKKKKIQEL